MGAFDGELVAEALFGRTRRLLLARFFGRGRPSYYLRELIRLTGAGSGAVQRELAALTAAGLLEREQRGGQVFYRANEGSPAYAELRALLVRTSGSAELLRAALQPLAAARRIELAFAHGAFADAPEGSGSPVSLVVIGDAALDEVVAALAPAAEELGRPITPTVYSPADVAARVAKGSPLLRSVLARTRVPLIGNVTDLLSLLERRSGT